MLACTGTSWTQAVYCCVKEAHFLLSLTMSGVESEKLAPGNTVTLREKDLCAESNHRIYDSNKEELHSCGCNVS